MPKNNSCLESMKGWGPTSFQEELEDTPQYDSYEDEAQNEQTISQLGEEFEPTQEVDDHYIRAEISFSIWDQLGRGHVVARSRDAYGNVMERFHTNPMLDTKMYIAESMYTQCN